MGAGVTATTDARTALYSAIALSPSIPAGRAHRYKPPTIATPVVWVGDVNGPFPRSDDGFRERVLQFEVVIVVDGADVAQLEMLDVWGDAVIDAAELAGMAVATRRRSTVDVGGPTLHTAGVFVEHTVHAPTLCPSTTGVPAHV